MADWSFLTNHGRVLVFLAQVPDARMREVAEAVGITERAVQLLVNDLVEAGYVERSRRGRSNTYRVCRSAPLRHPLEDHVSVGELIDVMGFDASATA